MSATKTLAVGYIRMSTDKQEDSPARQRHDIEALASRGSYRIARWYEDHGQTGTESAKRKNFQKLLADAKSGAFQAVLLSEHSRMSREDVFDAMVHWKLLRDAGVKIVTCQRGELDFTNLGGVITAIVDQYGAREESIKLADRVVGGKRLAVKQGHRQGGHLYGYDREVLDETGRVIRRLQAGDVFRKPPNWTTRLVVSDDRKAVEAVRFVFQAIGDGMSFGAVARELNRRGCRTAKGKRFASDRIIKTVTNPAYQGDVVYGATRRGRFRSAFDDGTIVWENAHEPLVDRTMFARAQRAVQARRQVQQPRQAGRYLLTGMIYLADNGRRMNGHMSYGRKRPQLRYYTLAHRYFQQYPEDSDRPFFDADIIERGVLNKLRCFLANAKTQRAIRNRITQRTRKARDQAASIERELAAVRAKIERATENLALADRHDIPGITRLLAGWRDEEERLREQLAQADAGNGPTPEALEIMGRVKELLDDIGAADREKLSFALRQTIHRVTLRRERRTDGRHTIDLWDGVIELRSEIGPVTTIPLTDEDIPCPGKWREVAKIVRDAGREVFIPEVADALGVAWGYTSRLLARAVLSGQIRKLGHQKGWIAT